jgi:hypothetical protein
MSTTTTGPAPFSPPPPNRTSERAAPAAPARSLVNGDHASPSAAVGPTSLPRRAVLVTPPSTAAPAARPATAKPARRTGGWMPRMWQGCDFIAWMRLLVRNRFAVDWRYSYIAIIVTMSSFVNMMLRFLQEAWYGHAIARMPIREAPIFVLGHWRTGTTLLHELLILDPRHGYPNVYQCNVPNHFLLTEDFAKSWLKFFLPSRRPMDNMAFGWDRPQECEFALCMMGVPSPYQSIAFPNRPPAHPEYRDLKNLTPQARNAWKKGFFRFLQRVTFKDPRRLVLKSPPHTCRIETLLEMFPDARFVHIVRDPYVVFPSTIHLWKSLHTRHGLQRPTFADLEEQVFSTFTHMYETLEKDRKLIEPSRLYEIRYEDLVGNPIGQMRELYEHLKLGGFEEMLPRLQAYFAENKDYATNRYQVTPEQRAEIRRRWGKVIERYGYDQAV